LKHIDFTIDIGGTVSCTTSGVLVSGENFATRITAVFPNELADYDKYIIFHTKNGVINIEDNRVFSIEVVMQNSYFDIPLALINAVIDEISFRAVNAEGKVYPSVSCAFPPIMDTLLPDSSAAIEPLLTGLVLNEGQNILITESVVGTTKNLTFSLKSPLESPIEIWEVNGLTDALLLDNKADKVPTATQDNFVSFDDVGNIKDSLNKASDFVLQSKLPIEKWDATKTYATNDMVYYLNTKISGYTCYRAKRETLNDIPSQSEDDWETFTVDYAEYATVARDYLEGYEIDTALLEKIPKTDIINDLTTGGTTKVLSAEQGKTLQDNKAQAYNVYDGFSGGSMASASSGGAVGYVASTGSGGAVGYGASAGSGGAVGEGSVTTDGFAGGKNAKTQDGEASIDAIQLGTGTNQTPNSLQVYSYVLMNADGSIPAERTADKEPLKGEDDNYVTDAEKVVIGNTSGANTGDETVSTIGTLINGADAKTTPVDADMVGLMDSADSNTTKKLSWAYIKSTLLTAFKNVGSGLAGLDANSRIAVAQLPTAVGRKIASYIVTGELYEISFSAEGLIDINRDGGVYRIVAQYSGLSDAYTGPLYMYINTDTMNDLNDYCSGVASGTMSLVASIGTQGAHSYHSDILLTLNSQSDSLAQAKYVKVSMTNATTMGSVLSGLWCKKTSVSNITAIKFGNFEEYALNIGLEISIYSMGDL